MLDVPTKFFKFQFVALKYLALVPRCLWVAFVRTLGDDFHLLPQFVYTESLDYVLNFDSQAHASTPFLLDQYSQQFQQRRLSIVCVGRWFKSVDFPLQFVAVLWLRIKDYLTHD